MKNRFKLIFVILSVLIFLSEMISAQTNSDSLFASAINDARGKNYDEAIEKALKILDDSPDRNDIMIFLANVYAWNGDYENALSTVEKAYSMNSTGKELYDSWLNILLWSGNFNRIIEVAELARQNNYPDNYNIVLRKALAYKYLKEYKMGIAIIDEHPEYMDSVQLKDLYYELKRLYKTRTVSVFYSIDLFPDNTFSPQHFWYVDYTCKIRKHTLITRLNLANRFNKYDVQAEADYYHIFRQRFYLYSNFGMSIRRTLFPNYSSGLELFMPVAKKSEASLGGRYLSFDADNVFVLTGNLNTYYKNFWFMVRPFVVFQSTINSVSSLFAVRLYSKTPANYWGVELLYGNSPDESYQTLQTSQQLFLHNYKAKIVKNFVLFRYHELKLSAAYSREEYVQNSYRNRLSFDALIKIRF